jgi:F-type H+-transporting ATPase subunit a
LQQISKKNMTFRGFKSILVAAFSLFCLFFSNPVRSQGKGAEKTEEKKGAFDANEVIFAHVLDAHQFHFLSYTAKDGKVHQIIIPLPVILYSPQRGLTAFMSSKFEEGEVSYDGYKIGKEKIVAVTTGGAVDPSVRVYDISLSRNVVQMLIALTILVLLMVNIAKKYKRGIGTTQAPTGFQNAMEPVITFIRDEVAKPNLGDLYPCAGGDLVYRDHGERE